MSVRLFLLLVNLSYMLNKFASVVDSDPDP
jgi:hypothetical protein